jgi:hypothetical protein
VRLTLFGLITNKLCTAVLALLEILSDSRWARASVRPCVRTSVHS